MREKISVVVLTYNPSKQKLIATLKSIIGQEDVDVQIIVSDDGSKENYFEEVKGIFEKSGFTDYILITSEKNQGTVKNAIQAVRVANGKYAKLISPGDMFASSKSLRNWINHLIESKYRWSICETIYYKNVNGCVSPIKQPTHPMIVDVYQKKQERKCRWNYVVLCDVALGAATICERELMLEYLLRIEGKVVFVEDSIHRIMMFDGICADYFPECAILYEHGYGVSTSNDSVWNERIAKDWDAAEKEMLSRLDSNDLFQKKMAKALKDAWDNNKYIYLLKLLFQQGRIKYALLRRFKMRYSLTELPENIEGVNWYANN